MTTARTDRAAEREMWALGDYGRIARELFWEVGERIVRRVGVRPGERVLDVACGTGNAALRAASAGARATGVDLTPELLDDGRALAARAGLEVDWVEGDAEALRFADGSFDVVLSTFGCMFAPRHDVAAREIVRVLRPGGRLGVCSWTPESAIADLMRAMAGYLPPAPDAGPPPPLWGQPEHVRSLFPGTVRLSFERESVEFRHPSVEAALELYESVWGPFVLARSELGERWPELRGELGDVLRRHDVASGGGLRYPGEYLTVTGRLESRPPHGVVMRAT